MKYFPNCFIQETTANITETQANSWKYQNGIDKQCTIENRNESSNRDDHGLLFVLVEGRLKGWRRRRCEVQVPGPASNNNIYTLHLN